MSGSHCILSSLYTPFRLERSSLVAGPFYFVTCTPPSTSKIKEKWQHSKAQHTDCRLKLVMMKKSHQTNNVLVHSLGICLVQIDVIRFPCMKINGRKLIKYIASPQVAWTEMQIGKKMYQQQRPYLSKLELMLLVRLDYNNESQKEILTLYCQVWHESKQEISLEILIRILSGELKIH